MNIFIVNRPAVNPPIINENDNGSGVGLGVRSVKRYTLANFGNKPHNYSQVLASLVSSF